MTPNERELYQQVLLQLRLEEEGPPCCSAAGLCAQERYPDLHERQIEENNFAWAQEREARVEGHRERVRVELCHCTRARRPGEATNGTKQKVWCVELHQCFDSLSQAARLTGKAPSNVLQAIRLGVRCGPFHFERFDPARHHPDQRVGAQADSTSLGDPCRPSGAAGVEPAPG